MDDLTESGITTTPRDLNEEIVVVNRKSPWRANRNLGRLRIAWHNSSGAWAGATLHPGEL